MSGHSERWQVYLKGVIATLLLAGCAAHKPKIVPIPPSIQPDGTTITCWWLNVKQAYYCPTTLPVWNIGQQMNAPAFPNGADCGAPIVFQFDDGHIETWVYPCWPQKNVPKCREGCKKP